MSAGVYISTHSGSSFYFDEPNPEAINLEDICHALSNMCRFTGHTKSFYSVAQHSVIVSNLCGDWSHQVQKQALLHDATEAYLSDINTPAKSLLKDYQELEHKVWRAICKRFDMQEELYPAVKRADRVAVMLEKRNLLKVESDWGPEYESVDTSYLEMPTPLYPQEAKTLMLERCRELRLIN